MQINMKAARVNAGLSQARMAELLQVSDSTVSRWEKGISPIPPDLFIRYCELCGMDFRKVKH